MTVGPARAPTSVGTTATLSLPSLGASRQRVRREPEKTVLYQVLAEHLETFLGRVAADPDRGDLPRFVVRELRAFLDCGILAHG